MKPAQTPEAILSAAGARLSSQYRAKGDLELYFIRQIAGCQLTVEAIQRNIDRLCSAEEIDDQRIDRLTRAQSRAQRMETIALKELKDLQARRNIAERFPDQTRDRPPLGDHFCYVGAEPLVRPPSPPQRRASDLAPASSTPNFTQHNPFKTSVSEALASSEARR